MVSDSAISLAITTYKQPAKLTKTRTNELPPDMLTLIKIAAGDESTIEEAVDTTGETADFIRNAAAFYLRHVIVKSDANSVRVLGLSSNATPMEVKTHKRWLSKWLHPDRNSSKWETALFHRVMSLPSTSYEGESAPFECIDGAIEANRRSGRVIEKMSQVSHRTHSKRRRSQSLSGDADWRAILALALKKLLILLLIVFAVALLAVAYLESQSEKPLARAMSQEYSGRHA